MSKSAYLALDLGALDQLQEVAEAIRDKPEELLGAKVGFEVTPKLHATFVFCSELLPKLSREELFSLHHELQEIVAQCQAEPLPFKRFELLGLSKTP